MLGARLTHSTRFPAWFARAFAAGLLLVLLGGLADVLGASCPPNNICAGSDREAANQVWGNISTWGQTNPPPANHFAFPIPVGMAARPLGMGEAFVAMADELSAIWYNPAGLVQTEKNEIAWMGGDRLTSVPYTGFFAANYMLQNRMNFALSYQRPYHAVGFYPDVIAGAYEGFTKWNGTGAPTLTIPGPPGSKVKYFDIADTAVQDFLKKAYRAYIQPAFQENILAFTYASPLSPDNNLSMGINVKYLFNDSEYKVDGQLLNEVSGYGVDLGFMYRYPMRKWGREIAFGLNLNNIAGQVRFNNNPGAGREVTLPTVTTLGVAWKTNEYFTRSDLNLAADLIYINDPSFDDNANRRINLGGEMWFFKHRLAPRAGYSLFFNRQLSRATLGISFRMAPADKNGLGLDYAFHFPSENEETATHWFSLNYRWGGLIKTPVLPDVSVSVDPPIFAPRRGETATFNLSAESPNGVDRWTLSIIDRNNLVVKVYQDRGEPPSQIVWGGEDKQYRLLPDGEYTFLFTATDRDGSSSSTPVQTLKIYTPKEPEAEDNQIDNLRNMIKAQDNKEEAVDQQVRGNVLKELQTLLAAKQANQLIPDVAKAPEVPAPLTPLAEAKAAAGAFAYPRVNDVPFPKTSVVTGADGKRVLSVEFATLQDQPKFILRDMADVARVAAGDAGLSVARYDIRATYGGRELRIVAPASAALSLNKGLISRDQFIENSAVTLDGAPLSPSYR
jgi:hypothetical protein